MAAFQIANKTVGKDAPVFIIAEAGINHDGKLAYIGCSVSIFPRPF